MDMLLKAFGSVVGLLVPALFIWAIRKGINASPFSDDEKASYARTFTSAVVLWTIAVWGAALAGLVSYRPGETVPRVLIALFAPTLIGWGMLASAKFRTILDNTPTSVLAGVQTYRLAGASFLLVVHLGILPAAFGGGGYGDIVTGSLALISAVLLAKGNGAGKIAFWAFTASGMFDLLNVLRLIVTFYPLWNNTLPSSAPLSDFALVMIPAMAAPTALILHAYAIRNALVGAWK